MFSESWIKMAILAVLDTYLPPEPEGAFVGKFYFVLKAVKIEV